jgi:hypothetical protein
MRRLQRLTTSQRNGLKSSVSLTLTQRGQIRYIFAPREVQRLQFDQWTNAFDARKLSAATKYEVLQLDRSLQSL